LASDDAEAAAVVYFVRYAFELLLDSREIEVVTARLVAVEPEV
jgi:hypothetical protein